MPADPLLSVIIVNYNTRRMTLDSLSKLHENLGGISTEIILIDNASQDGSVEAVRERFPQVRILEPGKNLGFGKANNLGMKAARGEYFMLLNTDAFVHPGAISAMIAEIQKYPQCGVLGSKLLNADGSLQQSCYPFPSPSRAWIENLWLSRLLKKTFDYQHWPHDVPREVDWLIGACMLLPRKVFQQVGGFDETFFMYAEETDWLRRIRDAGYTVRFTPDAAVTHLGGASGKNDKAKISKVFFESLDYYEKKHHGLAGLISLRLAMTIGCFLRFWLWLIVLFLSAAKKDKRSLAVSKVKLNAWLVFRQLTRWPIRIPTHPV